MTVVKHRITGVTVPQGGGRRVMLAILCTLLFLTFLDNTIVSVGLGSVQADLHAGVLAALQWIVGAYALTFASAMLAFGTVGHGCRLTVASRPAPGDFRPCTGNAI